MRQLSLLLLLLCLLMSHSVLATTCAVLPRIGPMLEMKVENADMILVGQVQEFDGTAWPTGSDHEVAYRANIKVLEAIKGADGLDEVVLWSSPSLVTAEFDINIIYLFFAQ